MREHEPGDPDQRASGASASFWQPAESRDSEAEWVAFTGVEAVMNRSFRERETDLHPMVAPCRAAISATVRSGVRRRRAAAPESADGILRRLVLQALVAAAGRFLETTSAEEFMRDA